MKCLDVQEKLSPYYDGELSSDWEAAIADHLACCEECAAELASFKDLRQAVSKLPKPNVPPTIWSGLSARLSENGLEGSSKPRRAQRVNEPQLRWVSARQLALAASILLMLGVGYWISRDVGHSHSGDQEYGAEFVATMDHYLQQLSNDPEGADRFLLDKYEGQTVGLDRAVQLVGYRPAVSEGLPEGYTLASTSVLTMPCCRCVKSVCERQDESTLVLFEHDDEKAEWFGQRPSSIATCGGKECCLVELDSSLAATWKRGSRSVTAVGIRDKAEVDLLVNWLDNKTDKG